MHGFILDVVFSFITENYINIALVNKEWNTVYRRTSGGSKTTSLRNITSKQAEALNLDKLFDNALEMAVRAENLDLVKWAYKRKIWMDYSEEFECVEKICHATAKIGNLEILKFFDEKGSLPQGIKICCIAAEHGHLEIIKWALNKTMWGESVYWRNYWYYLIVESAKIGGHTKIINFVQRA